MALHVPAMTGDAREGWSGPSGEPGAEQPIGGVGIERARHCRPA
ncbi:MAG: hypothetical protein ACXWQR_13095 [Ktedonobacterales bacterium]